MSFAWECRFQRRCKYRVKLCRTTDYATLPIQRHDSSEAYGLLPVNTKLENIPARAASKTSSRMSIERYLSAPLEDEPASVPAIDAALRKHSSRSAVLPTSSTKHESNSRESSFEATSEGRQTMYTSGSGADSTATSHSVPSHKFNKPGHHHHHHRGGIHPQVPELPKIITSGFGNSVDKSPERPVTSGTVDVERTWAEEMDNFLPGYQEAKALEYKIKAEQEIAQIQEKAKLLEEQMMKFRAERENAMSPSPSTRVTDEMAYAQMAARPKLAWILGGDISDSKSIERPKSSGSVLANSPEEIEYPGRPSSHGALEDSASARTVRRAKSHGALEEFAHKSHYSQNSGSTHERKSVRPPRFYCTFCQKRFHSRLEWMRHEENLHIPEQLWVCCPRMGEFPERCPFCSKRHPSPSHLADHNYISCQERPLSERTFSRKDHFLQHIAQVHKVNNLQKPLRLTELLEAWKHPLPLKDGHQALHCGFCGQTFETYVERTQHVGGHFLDGLDMMSWWSGRVGHDVEAIPPEMTLYDP
ncbi:hypothetical protein BCR34DRAFT_197209 [Clohesyomyces aquaticus]|uniref:C2H2-type domain-containing protein n=1 Tax=Clohesyomyces aquaticus TaxID=1231657 RepID=A0A1Y1ZXP4_9PLEO|nr:hypothetical protein BCR34DRAFT_197209 [Clohesyomyces aquaticus]